jgi:geranylgeranyl reductase family protein
LGPAETGPYNRAVIDVAVVGGGPAGLLTAARLAGAGLDVVLFEEHARIGEPTHCSGIVSLETAELAKIPDDLVLAHVRSARLHGPGGAQARHEWAHAGEAILAIDRAGFDRGLAAQACAAGAVVKTGTPVRDVEIAADGVTLQTPGDLVRARACVLACGVSYRFQRRLGLGLPAQAVHTAQTEVDAVAGEHVELYFGREVAPNGFLWTVPIARDGRARLKIGVMATGDAGAYLQTFLDRPEVRARLLGAASPPIRRLLPLKPIAKTYGDRVLVVGDAGGFTKPTTGGGVFYSLLTASLAAEALVEAFNVGRLDDAFLARYERRWQERLGAELRAGDWLRQLVSRCTDAEIDRLVRAFASEGLQTLVRRTVRFNWHRDLILALGRQPTITALLFRTLFR